MGFKDKLFGKKRGNYQFRNPNYYSKKPASSLKGVILLAPLGQAENIAKSRVFIGTVEDTVGTWFDEIKRPITAIGDGRTVELFNRANAGDQTAMNDIISTAVNGCLQKTGNAFPPTPVENHYYIVRALPSNEVTGSCFLVVLVY